VELPRLAAWNDFSKRRTKKTKLFYFVPVTVLEVATDLNEIPQMTYF
jgi:hypothetical protein